jgi:hypothetical protein
MGTGLHAGSPEPRRHIHGYRHARLHADSLHTAIMVMVSVK